MASGDYASGSGRILALSGGVGGAKLALGLSHCVAPNDLVIVANTGDDFTHMGLRICPDIDTLVYTLSGLANPETGWGRADEGRRFMEATAQLGGDTWFFLGDSDLAMHVVRSHRLSAGVPLSRVTQDICQRLGIGPAIVPMSDHPVPTMVHTDAGTLAFQDYFVARQCAPEVTGFHFEGADAAPPAPGFIDALESNGLDAVVICPSNPFISIDPILALPAIRNWFAQRTVPVVAVSPVIGGTAVKGPTAKMMQELNQPVNNETVAAHYAGLIDGLVIDCQDKADRHAVEALGLHCTVTATMMRTLEDRIHLAEAVLAFAKSLGKKS